MNCPACQAENAPNATSCLDCGQSLSHVPEVRPGFVLASRYVIKMIIGKGGMGVVYRAHDRLLDETVVIKVLRPEVAETAKAAQRFISEIKLARAVSHKYVCRIHEYGEDRGIRYVSMAFVDGVDLKRTLTDRGPMPGADAFETSIRVAEGLQAIHEEGIIHRDLKSNNIMLDSRGNVRLMDFGIAKHQSAQSGQGMTATGHIVGTPEYMSPEQVRGEKLDFRSDLYSLGIVIFELFTGRTPFRGETPVAVILKQLQDPPPLHGEDSTGLPAALVPVLARTLAKDRDERYGSARELGRALEEARDVWRTSVPTMVPALPRTAVSPAEATHTRVGPTPLPVPAPIPSGPQPARKAPAPPPVARPTDHRKLVIAGAAAFGLAILFGWGLSRVRTPRLETNPGPASVSPPIVTESIAPASPSLAPSASPSASIQAAATAAPASPGRAETDPRSAALRRTEPARTAAPSPRPPPASASVPPERPPPEARRATEAGRIDAMLTEAEKSLEAQKYEAAIAAYEEVLKLDPGNEIARLGRATAVNARVTARAMVAPGLPTAKKLVSGKTRADSAERRTADKSLTEAFDTSGTEVTRDTQSAALPGRIEFRVEPEAVRAGERYSIAISLFNAGNAPIEVREVLVTTTVNDRRASGAVPFQTRVVGPGQKGLLLSLSDFWMENLRHWGLEVVVRTTKGEVYRNDLAWK